MVRRNLGLMMASLALAGVAGMAEAQQAPADPGYQGTSHPPSDAIETTPDAAPVIAKPSAGVVAQQAPTPQQNYAPQSNVPQGNAPTVSQYGYAPVDAQPQPLMTRPAEYNPANDPDGDIVHPRVARPGELLSGATIRVRLMDRLSSSLSEKGEPFHGQVASDVLQNGRVLIPAGSGIEGRVSAVSTGHFGGHGSLRLRPEAVILPDGSRFQLHAETTGTPGSKTRVGGEGNINPGSRAKRDGIEYGAVVGTGVVTGAVIGGPVGALTGGLIGAGVVTTHLMVDHPQTTLEPGSVLLFTLTEPMNLMPAGN
jgi:hypothetical protein